jgi:hypothetical protein
LRVLGASSVQYAPAFIGIGAAAFSMSKRVDNAAHVLGVHGVWIPRVLGLRRPASLSSSGAQVAVTVPFRWCLGRSWTLS